MGPVSIHPDAYPEQILGALRDEIRRQERERRATAAARRRRRIWWAALRKRLTSTLSPG